MPSNPNHPTEPAAPAAGRPERPVEVWTIAVAMPGSIERIARGAEAIGFDGLGFADTQNLAGDAYVALGLAARATERLRLGITVTNPVTRHVSVTASAIMTVQAESGGRAVLGVGRGDSALSAIGQPPVSAGALARFLTTLRAYLRGEEVPLGDGVWSSNAWIARMVSLPRVPVAVAATGPRVIAVGARQGDRLTFAVGADPGRVAWALDQARRARADAGLPLDTLELGAYVNVVAHRDAARARDLMRGTVASFAHFSGMSRAAAAPMRPDDRAIVADIHRRYDGAGHLRGDAAYVTAMDDGFLDRFGVAGSPARCAQRLAQLVELGLDHLVLIGPGPDAAMSDIIDAWSRLGAEVLPAPRSAARRGDGGAPAFSRPR